MEQPSQPNARNLPPPKWVAEVFRERQTALVAYTTARLAGNAEDARDVVQEAFVKLCQQRWPDIEKHAAAWLYKTCRNRAIDILRREKRMSTAKMGPELSGIPDQSAREPSEAADRDEQLHQVRQQVGGLSQQQQEVLRLRLHDGLSYKQIAEVTGLSVSSVGFQLHDAISRLRSKLSPSAG